MVGNVNGRQDAGPTHQNNVNGRQDACPTQN